MIPSLYIHLPFCRRKCFYCDFNAYAGKDALIAPYQEALLREIGRIPETALSSVYIGGGTPSQLDASFFERLFLIINERFAFEQDTEITVEANPESLTRELCAAFIAQGINRVCIGLQSMNDEHLSFLGRTHTVSDFQRAYREARNAGFNNISVDLLYGLPGMTVSAWAGSLQQLIDMKPDHVSLYALSIDEGTTVYEHKITVDDDRAAEQYTAGFDLLERNGYRHYEIFNAARAGKESRHSMHCWNGFPYYGAGAGAASFMGNKRWRNVDDIEAYIEHQNTGTSGIVAEEYLDLHRLITEKLFLGLHKTDGVVCSKREYRFMKGRLSRFEDAGLLEYAPPVMRLTARGMLCADRVWRELV